MADDPPGASADAGANRAIPYRHAADVSVSTDRESSESRFFLKTASGAVFAFGEHEHFLWRSLDGRASFAGVERSFASQFCLKLTPSDLSGFIAQGVRCGLIEHHGDPSDDFGGDFEFAAAQHPAKQTEHRSNDRLPQPRQGTRHSKPIGVGPWTIIVGDPTKLFAFLGALFGRVRLVIWLVFPAAFVAGMIVLKNTHELESDWRSILASISWWPCLYLYEHSLQLGSRIIEGTIIQAHGGAVRYFGLRFLFGVIMRGFIDEHAAMSIPKRGRLWAKAGPLLLRLSNFVVMIFAWIELRPAHPAEAKVALFVAVISFILLCVNACPLVLAEGYELLAISLNQPKLAVRAYRLVGIRLSGRAAPPTMSGGERIGLVFFALGTVLANGYILLAIIIHMGDFVTSDIQGLGYLIMTNIAVATLLYSYALTKFIRKAAATRRTARRKFAGDALLPSH